MYSLFLTCRPDEVDLLSAELWEAGTSGIREIATGNGLTTLIAAFDTDVESGALLEQFSNFAPDWAYEPQVDWVGHSERSWPPRSVGQRLFLAPPWSTVATPAGRERIIHNPGLASGTGEHPCTRLALEALEQTVTSGSTVIDIGTGSGILSIAALRLGATLVVGCDHDETALAVARENFQLNGSLATLVAGSADCFRESSADLVVANINASVLLALADDLLSMLRPTGAVILTGFPQNEWRVVEQIFQTSSILMEAGWVCLISRRPRRRISS
jgi:ribosomal protein L11 methyltransferase